MSWTLAIETGGTFTDIFVVGPDGAVFADKVPSTPDAPDRAAATAFARALQLAGVEASAISRVLHGSTVAVNALIERRARQPALLATRGFRDMIFIGRQEKTHIYDMAYRKPAPFIDRAHVFEIDERIGPDGQVERAPDADQIAATLDALMQRVHPDSIAVCLLHAYVNPAHEQAIERIVRDHHPDVQMVLSSNVCPVHREYERASTTVINAFLQPVVDRYLDRFEQVVRASGCQARPLIMQANGGVLPVAATRARPAGLFLSGPSAAVAGAASLARQAGLPSLITLDVGGTSTDICLVTDGEVHETGHGGAYGTVQDQPLNMVMTDIVTIGAGGGSLAWVDEGGMLRVGPKSAGAEPGPACYDRGGEGFTLTDAMLCLGLLADRSTLPGGIQLSLSAARRAAQPLMRELNLGPEELADAVYRIAVANMAEAIRSVTLRRGYDPRDYALFACGGAGPLVAGALADELELGIVLVPPDPGVFSAFGLTAAGLRMDFARAVEQQGAVMQERAALARALDELEADAQRDFAALDVAAASLNLSFTADVRYLGQGFELRVPFCPDTARTQGVSHIAQAFHAVHTQRYGHAFEDQRIEITALRLNASAPSPALLSHWRTQSTDTTTTERPISLGGQPRTAIVVDRATLPAAGEASRPGPLLCLEPTTTTVVPHGWLLRVDRFGLLHLEKERV
ncbi:MAG: hydantoinase/oxoprolinase family protein [Gammaproteobacteria bacterium]|nr:hydantoinase/oxoprolinase family protein [Gammaproteobacteria bacterium]